MDSLQQKSLTLGTSSKDFNDKKYSDFRYGFKVDVQNLAWLHVAFFKAERDSLKTSLLWTILSFNFVFFMIALGVLRLVDAMALGLGEKWHLPLSVQALISGSILVVVGFCAALLGRRILTRLGQSLARILDVLKEDFKWLKNLL